MKSCHKKCYANGGQAEKARIFISKKTKHFEPYQMDIYFCEQCSAYHLGHVSKKELTRRINLDKKLDSLRNRNTGDA